MAACDSLTFAIALKELKHWRGGLGTHSGLWGPLLEPPYPSRQMLTFSTAARPREVVEIAR